MKFQRRILPPHSPTYLEMEEYITPSSSHQSISMTGSASDLSEIGSICCLSSLTKQRSDSLTNLFHMSEDSTSLSNLSIASYSLSQHSCENGSYTNPTTYTTISPVTIPIPQTSVMNESDRITRKQYSSSYRNLTEEHNSPTNNRKLNPNTNNSRRSGDSTRHYHFCSTNMSGSSSTTSSQKSFPIKTAETVLNTIGINTSSSSYSDLTDKCGLIANDANDIENNEEDDNQNQQQQPYDDLQSFCENHYIDSSDENELDMISTRQISTTNQTGRGLRKTVLNNVDRLLNSGNKQIKL
jgi:hypothetical protein